MKKHVDLKPFAKLVNQLCDCPEYQDEVLRKSKKLSKLESTDLLWDLSGIEEIYETRKVGRIAKKLRALLREAHIRTWPRFPWQYT